MSLDEYAAKRRFEKTPEPPPSPRKTKPAAKPYFCVQRHDATRLHYDFRLEIDGVLKSWAVPKGPSLDPAVKVFAAHVEDHPVEYGDFEGNIPAGNYGGGSVMLWDRGTFDLVGDTPGEAQMARGDLKFRLHGEKLNGEFAIIHMKPRAKGKGNEWLLIKKRDEFATPGWDVEALAYSVLSGRTQEEIARNLPARKTKRKTAGAADRVWATSPPAKRARAVAQPAKAAKTIPAKKKVKYDLESLKGAQLADMPASIEPMKATIGDRVPRGTGWLFEVKWDGVRAVAFIDNEEVRLQARSGLRCERQYPELAVMPHHIGASQAVIDGEIAVLDAKGVSPVPSHTATNRQHRPQHHRSPGAIHAGNLFRLRPALPRWLRPAQRGAGKAARTLAAGADARPHDPHLRRLPGRGRGAARGRTGERSGGYCRQTREQWLRIPPQPRMDKIKIVSEQEFVIGGLHRAAGRSRLFRRAGAGCSEGRQTALGRQRRHRLRSETVGQYLRSPRAARHEDVSLCRTPQAGSRHDLVKPELVCQVRYANWTTDDRTHARLRRHAQRRGGSYTCDANPSTGLSAETTGQLLPATAKEATLTIDGHALKFTNLPKLYYPDDGVAKRDVLNYYAAVADLILPYLKDRPLSLKRYPNGIKEQFFFQKDAPASCRRSAAAPNSSTTSITSSPRTTPACSTWSTWAASITTLG